MSTTARGVTLSVTLPDAGYEPVVESVTEPLPAAAAVKATRTCASAAGASVSCDGDSPPQPITPDALHATPPVKLCAPVLRTLKVTEAVLPWCRPDGAPSAAMARICDGIGATLIDDC